MASLDYFFFISSSSSFFSSLLSFYSPLLFPFLTLFRFSLHLFLFRLPILPFAWFTLFFLRLLFSLFPSGEEGALSLSLCFFLFFSGYVSSSCALSLICVRVPLSYVSPTKINWHRLGTQPYHDIHCQYWVLTYTPPPHT